MLGGRLNVLKTPQALEADTVLISGHHGINGVGDRRIILDSSGGKEFRLITT